MVNNILTTEKVKKFSVDEVYSQLKASKNGLNENEAKERLERFGYNEIPEKKVNPVIKFLKNFWGPIPWMIEVAIVLSAIIGHWEDFWIILILLMVNGVVRFWEENKADNAIELLKSKLAVKARVLRDGVWHTVPAKELVPGDIIRIRLGDIIPGDLKLIKGDYLQIDESALTGESLPVEKHVSDIGYSGSIVKQGEMDGIVVSTGMKTYFGKTTELVEKAKTHSHFQKAVVKIGNFLIIFALCMVGIIIIVSVLNPETSFFDLLEFILVLVVASIPVALPAVLSVTMAIGAINMAKKNAIVSKLISIEELAGVEILCSDKTGTLTKNEISVATIKSFGDSNEEDVILNGILASREEDQDPIDNAIIVKGKDYEDLSKIIKGYTVEKFTPFDPVIKRTEVLVQDTTGKSINVIKGAPQVILSLSVNKDAVEMEVNKFVDEYASKGYRALGVAKTSNGKEDFQFIGLIGLFDPPREDSAETIKTAQDMGMNVKMVTGDHVAIAKETALSLGLGTNIKPVSAFLDKPDDEAEKVVEEADGFAQVFPEHKYRIVELLQKKDHIVGMTGDGVNDAPALKKADVGIAVSNATDAAKSAAEITFTKPGLSVIIDGTIESRKIFHRMLNYSIYRISETIRVIIFITLSIVIIRFYPVTALMIVLLALLNDAPIMTIAVDNVGYSKKPERWNMSVMLMISTILGVIGVVASFSLYYIGLTVFGFSPEQGGPIQAFIFLKLSVAASLTVYVARTKGHFWERRPAKLLFLATTTTQILAVIFVLFGILLPRLDWVYVIFVLVYAFIWFLITDFIKYYFYKFLRKRGRMF
ncbi:MAG: plasma-membrane proton-efflux P-type ATPase [Promethearchaeota archaeon]